MRPAFFADPPAPGIGRAGNKGGAGKRIPGAARRRRGKRADGLLMRLAAWLLGE